MRQVQSTCILYISFSFIFVQNNLQTTQELNKSAGQDNKAYSIQYAQLQLTKFTTKKNKYT